MAESATRKAAAKGGSSGKGNFLPPLRVRYYKKMKRQHVYPMTVEWKKAERGVSGKEVTLRLLVGGAQVSPVEQNLDPTDPEDKVMFYVTPLAKGRLGNPHLEVVYQGRKVQEMPLPAVVSTQGRSWFFLIMAFVVAWLIQHYCINEKLSSGNAGPEAALKDLITQNAPDVPPLIAENAPFVQEWLVKAREFVAYSYGVLCEVCEKHPEIPLCVFGGFLLLAFLSWWWNSDKRRRRLGQPIPIPALGGGRQEEE